MLIADAHLDLAYNALRGRPVTEPASKQTADAEGIPTVGLPDLRRGGVGLICGTVFVEPAHEKHPGYTTAGEAHAAAMAQLQWYADMQKQGEIRLVRTPAELPEAGGRSGDTAIHSVTLLEGADPIRTPEDVADFVDRGVRIVGLAWKRTRYAGGTGAPGPLTPEGIRLVHELDRFGIIHDASHLAEESFWRLMKTTEGPVIASHSNCRSIVPTDRQLSDPMIAAILERGGVIGINFFDRFLIPPAEYSATPRRRATLSDVVAHMRKICDLAQSTEHVGLGTDMDGGLGRNEIPEEIQTSADLHRLQEALASAGFSDGDIENIMGGNWLRYFRKHLPGG